MNHANKVRIEPGKIFLVDVTNILLHRKMKTCFCISAAHNKYFFVNTTSRGIMYDDFPITGYEQYDFPEGEAYFVACSHAITIPPGRIKKFVGTLSFGDLNKVIDKIQNSKNFNDDEKPLLLKELEERVIMNAKSEDIYTSPVFRGYIEANMKRSLEELSKYIEPKGASYRPTSPIAALAFLKPRTKV